MSVERADQPAPDHHGIPGKTLAAQREAMGWTVEQVADQLKLAVRQVIALEEGDYANLPGPAVVRGFVRAYAKVVKLDPIPLVAQIALDTPAATDLTSTTVRRDKPVSKPTTFSQARYPSNGKRASKFPLALVAGAVLLIGAAVAAWQFGVVPGKLFGGEAKVATDSGVNTDANVTMLPQPIQTQSMPAQGETPAKPVEELKPVISNAVPLISVPPVTAASNVPAVPGAVPAPAVAASGVATTGDALVISVREDSWVEVRPAKGKALISRLVKGGQTETVAITGPVTLIVGKPSAVDATLRGAPVALPPVAGGRVARVALK